MREKIEVEIRVLTRRNRDTQNKCVERSQNKSP
jgi:hypothetical protein